MKTLILIAALVSGASAMAEGCFLKDHPEKVVTDRSIENQKALWNACIDKKLAHLDETSPNFFDEGQAIGDECTSAKIVCEI